MESKKPTFKSHYDNFIGGNFVAPVNGEYFENTSPIDGKVFTKAARSGKEDIELALDLNKKLKPINRRRFRPAIFRSCRFVF